MVLFTYRVRAMRNNLVSLFICNFCVSLNSELALHISIIFGRYITSHLLAVQKSTALLDWFSSFVCFGSCLFNHLFELFISRQNSVFSAEFLSKYFYLGVELSLDLYCFCL